MPVPELRTCSPTLLMLEQFAFLLRLSGWGENRSCPHLHCFLWHDLLFSHHGFPSPVHCLRPSCLLQGVFLDTVILKPPPRAKGSSLALNFHNSLSEPTVAIAFFCCLSICLSPPTIGRLWLWFILFLSHSMRGQGPTSGRASGPDPDNWPARDRIL